MFGNFLYYIIALLIYSTYQPTTETYFTGITSFFLFISFFICFILFTRLQFNKIKNMIGRTSAKSLDQYFHSILFRQSILAIFIYAINIYVLNLGNFFRQIILFDKIPTIEALVFLSLFISYLSIVWIFAYPSYHKIYRNNLSRKVYVLSNISFSIPVILPWLILSLTADIINVLPFTLPKELLSSTEGQVAYFMIFLLAIAILGPLLIQKFWGCRPLRFGVTRYRIEALCKTADMKYRDILVWPLFGGRMITAGVMGLIRRFRYILVTPALIRHLDPSEIDSVIAHEIGHIKKHHLFFYLLFFAGYLILSFATIDLILYSVIYIEAVYGLFDQSRPGFGAFISIGFSLVMISVFLVYFRYIFGYFMRNFERQADLYALNLMNGARELISTFQKITATSGQDPARPNWHHFSIKERIEFLQKCETDKTLTTKHDNKIKKSIAIYLAAMLLAGFIGYQFHFENPDDIINSRLLKKMLLHQIESNSNNPDLYQMLGDVYFSEKNFEKTIDAYENAIALDPFHVNALNNLAWLFATCENHLLKNPEKAVSLALRAVSISEETHILDTLAEAYFADGNYEAAIKAETKAIEIGKEDLDYYHQQLKKFKSAREAVDYNTEPSD